MRFGATRADRLGFTVFAVLAGLLAILLITNLGSGGTTETSTPVTTFADLPDPTTVPTTAPMVIPDPTPTPTLPPLPTATPTPEVEVQPLAETAGDEDDGDTTSTGTTTLASTETSSSNATGGDSATTTTTAASVPAPAPEPTVPNPQPATTTVPNPQPATTTVPNPQPSGDVTAPPPNPTGGTFTHTLTAVVAQPTLYTSPGGSTFMPTFSGTPLPPVNPTVFGNPLVYRVIAGTPGDAWAQVYVPARPNGQTAWVQTSQFTWGSSNRMIQINISTNTVTVFEGSNVLITTAAVTGKSSSRTPVAQGWVEETMAGPSSAYGPLLISLGIFSNDLNSFGGGVPKVALHGTNNPSLMGQYASNGCIRVPNDVISQIASMVSPGSKVVITT